MERQGWGDLSRELGAWSKGHGVGERNGTVDLMRGGGVGRALLPAGCWGNLWPLTPFSSPGLLGKVRVQLQSYHSSSTMAGEQWSVVGLSAPLSDLSELKPRVTEVFQLQL